MCALAQMLRQMGYKVGGSDCNESDNLSRLCEQGVPVHLGHDPALVQGADLVVYSAAIAADNPERLEADRLSIPQASRAELFGAISRLFKEVIAVSGTHGKTTTTGMITQLLASGEKAPSAIVGGYLPFLDGNGRLGARDLLVCEACEFADTFLHLSRDTAVLLNIDDDHLEYFGTSDRLVESFHRFAREAKRVVAYGEDARVLRAVAGVDGEVTTFGFNRENEHYTDRVECVGGCYSFDWMRRGKKLARICLSVAGRHNILNALAAAVVAWQQGMQPDHIARELSAFTGVCRRFEVLCRKDGITVADDYAHHPTELEAVLTAARQMGFRRIIAVFQPFTFSRTFLLMKDFARVLSAADQVVLAQIMGSREINTFGVTAEQLRDCIPGALLCNDFDEIAKTALSCARQGDLILTLGCGDIYKAAKKMVKALRDGENSQCGQEAAEPDLMIGSTDTGLSCGAERSRCGDLQVPCGDQTVLA